MSVRIFRENGPVHIEWHPKDASVAFSFDEPVVLGADGVLIPYTPGINKPFLGLIKKTIASTDSDYASETRVPVEVGNENTEYLITASTTAAAATDVGEFVDYVEATVSVNVGVSTEDDFYVTQVISTVLVVGRFVRRTEANNLQTAFT